MSPGRGSIMTTGGTGLLFPPADGTNFTTNRLENTSEEGHLKMETTQTIFTASMATLVTGRPIKQKTSAAQAGPPYDFSTVNLLVFPVSLEKKMR